MKKSRDSNTFFISIYYCYHYYYYNSKALNWVSVRERQRRGDDGRRLAENCYIDLFLTDVVLSYSETYVLASLTRDSQPRSVVGCIPLHPPPRVAPNAADRDYPWLCVIDRLSVGTRVYILPVRDSRDLLPLVNTRELSSCLHSWNILSQKSLIDGSVIHQLSYKQIEHKFLKQEFFGGYSNVYIYIYIYINLMFKFYTYIYINFEYLNFIWPGPLT